MKKVITILVFIILTKVTIAQSYGVPDTLLYLQTIVANKSQYIGQPFSFLCNNLQVQIKSFSPFPGIPSNKNKETSTSFSFYLPQTGLDDFYLTYPKLEIYWQVPLNAYQSGILFRNSGGAWNSNIYDFYKNGNISDIILRN